MAQSLELPFLMFETNSASCGGFAGVSDSFGSSLWALDYGLQMAYSNFTGALLYVTSYPLYPLLHIFYRHIGGQGNYYNVCNPLFDSKTYILKLSKPFTRTLARSHLVSRDVTWLIQRRQRISRCTAIGQSVQSIIRR